MKSFHKFLPVLLLMIALTGCSQPTEKVYRNKSFDFQVSYPARYEIKEYVWEGIQQSAELKSQQGVIDIRAMGAGTMYDKMSFDEYARIAASVEIQNYEKLVSIKPFVSDSGIKGYKTFWRVIQTVPPEDFDKPELYPPYISGPIYYFPPREKKYIGRQPVKVIMLSCYVLPDGKMDQAAELELEKIAKSFRYL